MLQLELLEERACPAVGTGLIHPQIVNITMTDATTAAYINTGTQVMATNYLSAEGVVYGVGQGSLIASINISPLPGSVVNQQLIGQEIATLISEGAIPSPSTDPNTPTLYNFVLPVGQTDSDIGGDSAGFQSSFVLAGKYVPMTIDYGYQPAYLTVAILGHEVIEDMAGYTQSQWASNLAPGTFTPGSDVADKLMWNPAYEIDYGGYQFFSILAPNGSAIMPPGQPNPQAGPLGQQLPLPVVPPTQPSQIQPITVQVQQFQQQITAQVQVFQQLTILAIAEFDALAFRLLALVDPKDFTSQAQQAQQELDANPLLSTPLGQVAQKVGEEAFIQVLEG